MSEFDVSGFVEEYSTATRNKDSRCLCMIGRFPAAYEAIQAISGEMKKSGRKVSSERIALGLSGKLEGCKIPGIDPTFSVSETTVKRHLRFCVEG